MPLPSLPALNRSLPVTSHSSRVRYVVELFRAHADDPRLPVLLNALVGKSSYHALLAVEAARVLGYSGSQTFFKIILPQVIKRILPSVTNEVITLVKDTSLAFSIAYAEMFTQAKALAASAHNVLPLIAAGIFYYVFNFIVAEIMALIEKSMRYYD